MASTTAPQRRMRADARRNYERLLSEAEAVFSERGTEASLEEIARRAGVAIGTLYGHFPSRQALLSALLRDRQDELFRLADELMEDPSPDEALRQWVRAVVAHAAAYGGLADMLAGVVNDPESELYGACQQMTAAGDRLLARARVAGSIRPDATGADIYTLINAAAWLQQQVPSEQADRLLTIVLDGLKPT